MCLVCFLRKMAAGNSKNLMPTEVKEEEKESDTESVVTLLLYLKFS